MPPKSLGRSGRVERVIRTGRTMERGNKTGIRYDSVFIIRDISELRFPGTVSRRGTETFPAGRRGKFFLNIMKEPAVGRKCTSRMGNRNNRAMPGLESPR
jgi:hypothetical protein